MAWLWILIGLIGTSFSDSLVDNVAGFPAVLTLIDDDYPYQCVCKCEDNQRLGMCDYDKTSSCFCDFKPSSNTQTNVTTV